MPKRSHGKPLNERKDYDPSLRKDFFKVPFDQIIAAYTEAQLACKSRGKAYVIAAKKLNVPVAYVAKTVAHHHTRERVAEATTEVVEKIFDKKVPMLQNIVGLTLQKLEAFIKVASPETVQDAKDLAAIVTNFNNLLRLELGQSTENIAVAQMVKVSQDVKVLIQNLAQADPFVDYGKGDEPNG